MECPRCGSTHIRKNGSRNSKQRYICADCRRQFLGVYELPKGYLEQTKRECLTLYVNGMGLRGIERSKGVHHTTVGLWVKQVGQQLPNAPQTDEIPEVTELDELETFVGSKKTKSGCGRR